MDLTGGLLSPQAELAITQAVAETFKQLQENATRNVSKPDYIKQSKLREELGISHKTLVKMESMGLRRVVLDEESRTVFYSRKDLERFMLDHTI
jgi:hypothetical protein